MTRTLVVGRGFIGRAVAMALPAGEVRLAGHDEIADSDILRGIATILFAGRNPALGSDAWQLADDPELAWARRSASGRSCGCPSPRRSCPG